MNRLLGRMSDGVADELLRHARERLEMPEDDAIQHPVPLSQPASTGQQQSGSGGDATAEDKPIEVDVNADSSVSSAALGGATFNRILPPQNAPSTYRRLIIAPRISENVPLIRTVVRLEESDSLKVVFEFEQLEGRFPISAEYLRGSEAPGCDVVSADSEEARKVAERTRVLDPAHVARMIEVKGRSDRTGAVELSDNQRAAAMKWKERFFLYRVYRNPAQKEQIELAILKDPIDSAAEITRYQHTYNLNAGSGADWYQLSREEAKPVG
jgi:hypothetical protein